MSTISDQWIKDNEEYISYLFDLQKIGTTNMFGAAEYLRSAFSLDRKESIDILKTWMNNYDHLAKIFQIE